ncbi:MAG TPA: HisA/HisF-related TIM barrel protein [Methylophilaceae bacterium]|nr:HisA/HisF-related TIM barrel protein [Methylophilaceae bacterium]
MEIIPVIDLLNQQVVHARRGERQHYRPIQSRLTPACEPMAIVDAMLGLYPFNTLYIADLDAIQKRGRHDVVISQLRQRYPQLNLWVDAGLGGASDLAAWKGFQLDMVVGSESLSSMADYQALKTDLAGRMALSLDFDADGFRGPKQLLDKPDLWPSKVVVMTLARVGSAEGPDLERLQQIIDRQHDGSIYAAGGVRDRTDLARLESLGIQGALVASAIHEGGLLESQ